MFPSAPFRYILSIADIDVDLDSLAPSTRLSHPTLQASDHARVSHTDSPHTVTPNTVATEAATTEAATIKGATSMRNGTRATSKTQHKGSSREPQAPDMQPPVKKRKLRPEVEANLARFERNEEEDDDDESAVMNEDDDGTANEDEYSADNETGKDGEEEENEESEESDDKAKKARKAKRSKRSEHSKHSKHSESTKHNSKHSESTKHTKRAKHAKHDDEADEYLEGGIAEIDLGNDAIPKNKKGRRNQFHGKKPQPIHYWAENAGVKEQLEEEARSRHDGSGPYVAVYNKVCSDRWKELSDADRDSWAIKANSAPLSLPSDSKPK
jgi:hypothetical protein